jgi:hypothetical protein
MYNIIMLRKVIIFGCMLVVLSFVVGFLALQANHKKKELLKNINSYDTCVKAKGSLIQESYPPTCVTEDKRSFTQDIGNELTYTDLIQVDNPRPNQKIPSPLKITGKARGSWFFEASFPVELFDSNGKSLGRTTAKAEGEWMTEEFVSFTAQISYTKSSTSKGKLIIKNANPSGLPDKEKILIMPVTFK